MISKRYNYKSRKSFHKKQKKTNKNKKTKKRSQRSGTLLGSGMDGCIIDSISCNDFSKEYGYVAKIINDEATINKELHEKLAEIDPENKRFNRYYFPDFNSCVIDLENNEDYLACIKKGIHLEKKQIVFEKFLLPLDNYQMTKKQYRYLRDSLQILHENNISHGDLPNNVMVDPDDDLPRIIDWDRSQLNSEPIYKQMDYSAFIHFFRTKK
jgi:serine/threonine protein kinase